MLNFDENLAIVVRSQSFAAGEGNLPSAQGAKLDDTMLAENERRIDAADKRVINGGADVKQLAPFKYKWAWDKYLASCAMNRCTAILASTSSTRSSLRIHTCGRLRFVQRYAACSSKASNSNAMPKIRCRAASLDSIRACSRSTFIANRCCQQIGIEPIYPGAENPFPWMSEMIDLNKRKETFLKPGRLNARPTAH